MIRLIALIIFYLFIGTNLSPTQARQVGFKGSLSLISENTPTMNDTLTHYSPDRRFSLGLRHIRLEQKSQQMYAALTQGAILLHRWNKEDLQANLYTYGGAGALTFKDENSSVFLTGAQFDAEDRRFYGLFRFTTLLSGGIQDYYNYRTRLGIAPFLANYDELNAWVMTQYDFRPNQMAEHRVTPFVRLFYRSILVEVGSSTRGDWMINFVTEILI